MEEIGFIALKEFMDKPDLAAENYICFIYISIFPISKINKGNKVASLSK